MARHRTAKILTSNYRESIETIVDFVGELDDASAYAILALQPTKEEFAQAVFHMMGGPATDRSDRAAPSGKAADLCELLGSTHDSFRRPASG